MKLARVFAFAIFIFYALLAGLSVTAEPLDSSLTFQKPEGATREPSRSQIILDGIPWYQIQHGDGPTAVGMLFGYWDAHGFRKLIPGDAGVANDTIRAIIASDNNILDCDTIGISDHYHDYSCPIDPDIFSPIPDKSETGGAHPDNCIADYLGTSRSIDQLTYGSSLSHKFSDAFGDYLAAEAPQYDFSYEYYDYCEYGYLWEPSWEIFKTEIDANRPVILSWNLIPDFYEWPYNYYSPGSEWDMIAFGYEETELGEKYFAWHTDNNSDTIWIEWNYPIKYYGYPYPDCILSMITFNPIYNPKTIRVPSDFASLQPALAEAECGDTILVADGVYSISGDRIIMEGRPIILSENGPEMTIIDCGGTETEPHQAFIFESGEGPETKLIGFTIRNGYSTGNGGAIECWSSSPTIEDCIFENNRAVNGGAIYIENDASPEIRNCTFTNNQGIQGGAVYFGQYSNAVVVDCIIANNSASDGGGFYNNVSAPTIRECIFIENSAVSGGAIFNSRRGGGIVNCNFSLNSAEYGSGIAFSLASNSVDIQNSIIAFNTGGEAIYCPNPDRVPSLECTDIYGNSGGDWTGGIEDELGQSGNISANPLFCDKYNIDFGLYINSPCAAENNECGLLIGVMDVGCLTEYIIGDADGNGEIGVNDIVYLIEYYFNGGARPVPHVAGDLSCDGWVGLVDIIMLNDYFFHTAEATGCQ